MNDAGKDKYLVIVTGLSGSGKSIALNALEDMGYYCADKLPAALLPAFAREVLENPRRNCQTAAIGLDVHNLPEDLPSLRENIRQLGARGIDCRILFLEAEPDILLQRYSETRRCHPLRNHQPALPDAIAQEQQILQAIRDGADIHLDTSATSPRQLRELIRKRVAGAGHNRISLVIQSFGFKYGIPRNADFLFDSRCLANPYWQTELRALTGRDAPVAEFLRRDSRSQTMLRELLHFLQQWLACFSGSDRSYITIAIGCTGGQHRSVYIAEQLYQRLTIPGFEITLKHRDLDCASCRRDS